MNFKTFKAKYGHTLKTDARTKRYYLKLPVNDLNELAYLHNSLLEGIILLSKLESRHYDDEQLQSVMYWLSKLVLLSYPNTEMDGLSLFLEPD